MDGHRYTAAFEAPGGEPVLEVYLDTKGIPTVGLGHTGPDVKLGDTWTADRCWHTFYNDYAIATGAVPHVIGVSTFSTMNVPRQAVMVDLCFNPGPTKLALFHRMLEAIRAGKWQVAHDELLDSAYAGQVHGRATKNAQALLTGEWP